VPHSSQPYRDEWAGSGICRRTCTCSCSVSGHDFRGCPERSRRVPKTPPETKEGSSGWASTHPELPNQPPRPQSPNRLALTPKSHPRQQLLLPQAPIHTHKSKPLIPEAYNSHRLVTSRMKTRKSRRCLRCGSTSQCRSVNSPIGGLDKLLGANEHNRTLNLGVFPTSIWAPVRPDLIRYGSGCGFRGSKTPFMFCIERPFPLYELSREKSHTSKGGWVRCFQ